MGSTVLDMSISLDGYIAGPNVGPDNGLGDGGTRLHEWFLFGDDGDHKQSHDRLTGVNREVFDELMATGAVVVGRRTFELAGGWDGDHHDGVRIFVLSRREPPREAAGWPLVTYLSDVGTAMQQAKDAAGDRDVLVHGAVTGRLALAAGALDELQLHIVPVLLGGGLRLFPDGGPAGLELEPMRVLDGPGVTHLRYRVRR